jgi:cell division transport system permease protein
MKRILINAFKNIRRSPYQALAAILVLTLTLFVTQVFILLSLGSQQILRYFETRPQVTAFFNDEVTESDILTLKTQLESQSHITGVTYVSKDEALTIYRTQNADDPLLLEMVTADILPASIEVSAVNVDALPEIREYLEGVAGVDEVIYHEDVIDSLKRWTSGIRLSGAVIVGLLIFTSLLVITIIISIKAAAKRQEIATMRLLGATSWFIYGPFMFEGIMYGIIASLVAWIATYTILLYATPFLVEFLGEIPVLPVDPVIMLTLLGASAAIAALMGMIAGVFSSRRFGR